MMIVRRQLVLVSVLVATTLDLWAANPTLNDPSTSDVFTGGSEFLNRVEAICFVLGACCAVVGALRAYTEVIDGEEHLFIAVRNWFGSCLAFLIFPYIIRQLAGF